MYTSIFKKYNKLCVRGVENGRPYFREVEFNPTLFLDSGRPGQPTKWKNLEGKPVYEIKLGSMKDCDDFIKMYKDVDNFGHYVTPGYIYQYIADTYTGEIKWDSQDIKVFTIDIETSTEYGFPDIRTAQEEILLITIKDTKHKKVVTFGSRPFDNKRDDVKYVYCKGEQDLLKEFMVFWQQNYPDVITGWNSTLFDIPYLYNRMIRVVGETLTKKLSPWNSIDEREIFIRGTSELRYSIAGIAQLDYLDLYKKFTYSVQETYRLDYIAEVELGENKKVNPGDTFKEFYTNYWQQFVEYNIHDVELVDKLDDKLKLLDLAFTMAYSAKCLYEDVYSPVKTWDIVMYNYLRERNTVIPRRKDTTKDQAFEGAYVKDPLVGKHKWCVSFDLNSLYPHLIMQYNMSPETITDTKLDVNVQRALNKECDLQYAYDNNLAVAANGWCYRRDQRGLLPTMMKLYYDKRVEYKNAMLKAKQEYEETNDPQCVKDIARLNNLQMSVKILLNSAYGALGNVYFRYTDLRIAEGITLSGQLSIRWIANKLNDLLNKTMKTEGVDRVVLIDTDSVVLSLEDLVEKMCPGKTTEQKIKYMDKVSEQIIQPFLDKSYQELADYMNAYEQKMQMKRENLVDVMIAVAKKRYVMNVHNSEGVQYKEPKLKIMGLAMIKSSTPAVIRSKLKDSLKTILHSTEEDVQKYVSDYKEEFNKLSVEEIAFPRGISDVAAYQNSDAIYKKGTPIHVRGALLYNYHLKRLGLDKKYQSVHEGDKIKFVYLRTPNPINEDVISFIGDLPKEFDLHSYVDYNKMFEKTFQDAIQNVLDPLKWSAEPKAKLDDFLL